MRSGVLNEVSSYAVIMSHSMRPRNWPLDFEEYIRSLSGFPNWKQSLRDPFDEAAGLVDGEKPVRDDNGIVFELFLIK